MSLSKALDILGIQSLFFLISQVPLTSGYNICNPNGILEPGEECDTWQAGSNQNQGCDEYCQVEKGFVCTLQGNSALNCQKINQPKNFEIQMRICGNGILENLEECDNGNNTPNDGCDEFCQIQAGYTVIISEVNEQLIQKYCSQNQGLCMDKNLQNGDGCDKNCFTEDKKYCIYEAIRKEFKCYDRMVIIKIFQTYIRLKKIKLPKQLLRIKTSAQKIVIQLIKKSVMMEIQLILEVVTLIAELSLVILVKQYLEPTLFVLKIVHILDNNVLIKTSKITMDVTHFAEQKMAMDANQIIKKALIIMNSSVNTRIAMYQSVKPNIYQIDKVENKQFQEVDIQSEQTKFLSETNKRSINNKFNLLSTKCKNGKLEFGEQCDDGKEDSNSCDHQCKVRNGYLSSTDDYGLTSTLSQFCFGIELNTCLDNNYNDGDGQNDVTLQTKLTDATNLNTQCNKNDMMISAGEECDDGDLSNLGGCDQDCKIKEGWTCIQTSLGISQCIQSCLEYGLHCMDNNQFDGDGCNKDCQVELGYHCQYQLDDYDSTEFICTQQLKVLENEEVTSNQKQQRFLSEATTSNSICILNSVVEFGEECDEGTATTNCDDNCRIPTSSQNLIIADLGRKSESQLKCQRLGMPFCYDINANNNDGQSLKFIKPCRCSSACLIETGYVCSIATYKNLLYYNCVDGNTRYVSPIPKANSPATTQSTANAQCVKDSQVAYGEECDDGDTLGQGGKSRCYQSCLKSGTICLDLNKQDDDGCDKYCRVEPGYRCSAKFTGLTFTDFACFSDYVTTAPTTSTTTSPTTSPESSTTQPTSTTVQSTTSAATTSPAQSTTTPKPQTTTATTTTTTTTTQSVAVKECKSVISAFDITDQQFTNGEGEVVQCKGMTLCPDGSSPPCSWKRKIVTGCLNDDTNSQGRDLQSLGGNAQLRIQTNSLPNHCFTSNSAAKQNQIDFQVQFKNKRQIGRMLEDLNDESTQNYMFRGDNQNSVNMALCDDSWTQAGYILQVNPSYIEYSGDFSSIVGIALNGVPIHTGNSEYGSDVFHPKKFGTKYNSYKQIKLDNCLGSSEISGFYHYYGWSPCILPSGPIKARDAQECDNVPECKQDMLAYSLSFMKYQEKTIMVIGIARDGHSILGPYRSDGTLWQPCDVDLCNGIEIAGIYYYVTTMFHPYTVGCWGPGPRKTISQECSNNVKMCSSSITLSIWTGTVTIISIFVFSILI
ncbi:UNKNOWN [Stylonychia lemnae]|uniref:Uncharacterized protein n=1 Tax=Stylonychia lemnae TaxID=5949 RepID=A0A078B072_STYLE|nr:UNKNOWN [Stylonychia lemnae]|eukprot:CDW88065.1 UNKNOWN [Stylonychia lemnae]